MSEALSKLAWIYEAQGELVHSVEYARQLTELTPWSESNHRNLMRLLALNGMRSAALRQFQVCTDCLEKELDVSPSPATVALYEEIKAWESGVFVDGKTRRIPAVESQQFPHPKEDALRKSLPRRELSRRSVLVLFTAVLILGIGSVHWLGAQYRSSATASSENQAVPQIQAAKAMQMTALPTPTETSIPKPTSTPDSAASAAVDLNNQLQALVSLYEQTDGPNWENSGGWLSASSPCTWYGVTCRGEKIVKLELGQNRLNGTIPPEINKLGYLENLDLGNNQLSGNIPPELGDLSNLRYLTLWGNRELSGPIPPELGNLSNLERLELAHWENGGSLLNGELPPELGKLKNLRYLSISVSLLEGPLPIELCALTNLEDLYLDNNRLNGLIPPEIGKLVNLGSLDLGGNDFEGPIPPELGNLSMLTYLAFGDSLVSGEVPEELGDMVRLRNLVLDNTGLSGPLPLSLMNLNLRELTFWGTEICEPTDPEFQAWLEGIHDLGSSEIVCNPEGY